ncbi:MAG: YXWGXW repeat-containing protein [Acidobacteria bacterium]|nr:YXWGXW repeat-containing protein [Acidobacteriota bacterium]
MAMDSFRSFRVVLFAVALLALAAPAFAQISIAVSFGPPALPIYEQPPCPEEGYIWNPGYWDFDNDYDDYYWVPGTWVMAPEPGLYWTPGYWAWVGNGYRFYDGYWGPQVGFYGGINYGFGYFGDGYQGGRWDRDHFFYNRSVTNVNVTNIRNVYNTTVINRAVNRVSYNGGNGGVSARPTAQQEAVGRERHIPPVAAQTEHIREARSDRQLRASENRGKPPIAATDKPGALRDRSAVPAREAGGAYNPPANRRDTRSNGNSPASNPADNRNNGNDNNRGNSSHANDLPRRDRPEPVNSGNAKRDTKYQQDQDKLFRQQEQDRQKLQQRQDRDHQKEARQNADDAKKQQVEQRHQQQTQQLQQREEQQQQKWQQKHQPPQQQGRSQRDDRPPADKSQK